MRRLDENTSPDNFLHDLFAIRVGNSAWESQTERFLRACARKDEIEFGPNREQDRASEKNRKVEKDAPFENAPDTDWSLRRNAEWIRGVVEASRKAIVESIPLVIEGKEQDGESEGSVEDPSCPGESPYRHALAGAAQIEAALACAERAREEWIGMGFAKRADLLREVAVELAAIRGEAIATMVRDAGKAVLEGDVEVSEAIDFANYYARSIETDGSRLKPFGTVVVTPPWNFPFAIPCGGVLAALVAGNTVILKPASETVLTAWVMVQALWRAGIPREVLQFVPCPDNHLGRQLIADDRVGGVILTGAHETAQMFQEWKPGMRLFAETSGKNALVITAAADLDLAVKDLVRSAFGHSGQKCSAASLGIIEAEVYDSSDFRRQLRDAAASLKVGSSWEYSSFSTPVIRPPGPELKRALTQLEPGEEWLLEPRENQQNPCLWSPGIKMGVKPESWYRRTECFGPVLGLIRAQNLDDAIRIQNDSDFGLTGGIHSLDEREIAIWKDRVEVGNAYVNRPITGAIVRRQPFGGWKRSYVGPGAKAGGPNYVSQFGEWQNETLPRKSASTTSSIIQQLTKALPAEGQAIQAIAGSDAYWQAGEFSIEQDPSGFRCETNVFRYRRFRKVWIRIGEDLSDRDLARLILAAESVGSSYSISMGSSRTWLTELGLDVREETEGSFAQTLSKEIKQDETLRAPGASEELKKVASRAGVRISDGPVVWDGRWELPCWYREQAVSETRHRYGNLLP